MSCRTTPTGSAKPPTKSGLGLLKELAVISELKVGATVQGGPSNKSLRRDVDKLFLLLDEYQATHDTEPPLAYVCVLDNHARRQHSGDEIKDYCESVAGGRIKVLYESALSNAHIAARSYYPDEYTAIAGKDPAKYGFTEFEPVTPAESLVIREREFLAARAATHDKVTSVVPDPDQGLILRPARRLRTREGAKWWSSSPSAVMISKRSAL